MLHIVGGTYIERCDEPSWNYLYGSGLRAAVALRHISDAVTLHTYLSQSASDEFKAAEATFKIEAVTREITANTQFHYKHPLADPRIIPPRGFVTSDQPIRVEGESILRFGMIEGEAIVSGRKVVYDPQSPVAPAPFKENGSSAEQLAIVANRTEILKLARETDEIVAANSILKGTGAEVVIVKLGAFGLKVITRSEISPVPPFVTRRVWPIGSGDLFAAVFAHYWAVDEMGPIDAARNASLATAYYCATRTLPIPASSDILLGAVDTTRQIDTDAKPESRQVYLAGPFFTMFQRWAINESRKALLSSGIRVFSPFHDIGHGKSSVVVPADLEALLQSDVVLGLLDGLDPGTLFELGFARANDIPVVVFVQNESQEDLKMIEGSECVVCDDFSSSIYACIWEAFSSP